MAEPNEDTSKTEPAVPATGDDGLGDAGKRALDAERKARKAAEKRATDAEAKVQEAEDADKTEVERLTGQVATLTQERDSALSKADRFEVAAAKGLSLAQARRLVGSTKDELEQDADEMRTELGIDKKDPPKDEPATRGLPKEDLKSGASNEEDEEPDTGKLADSILKGW